VPELNSGTAKINFSRKKTMKTLAILTSFLPLFSLAQTVAIPAYYRIDSALSATLTSTVHNLGLDKDFDVGEDGTEQISLAVIDLTANEPAIAGVHLDNFIYPASVYKMYVAASILQQVSEGKFFLTNPIVVHSPNDVDRSKQLDWDPRTILHDKDTVTINYLLDLMITRSDNSAANCLIDLARRENINELMHRYGWEGSEVTRKFLRRAYEDSGYVKIRGTETCALHAADFMYRIYTHQLVNPWVSIEMKSFLTRQLDTTKLSTGLPTTAVFSHKTGWFSYWTNDVGIVEDGNLRYVIACFLPIEEGVARPKLKELSKEVYEYLQHRNAGR